MDKKDKIKAKIYVFKIFLAIFDNELSISQTSCRVPLISVTFRTELREESFLTFTFFTKLYIMKYHGISQNIMKYHDFQNFTFLSKPILFV